MNRTEVVEQPSRLGSVDAGEALEVAGGLRAVLGDATQGGVRAHHGGRDAQDGRDLLAMGA